MKLMILAAIATLFIAIPSYAMERHVPVDGLNASEALPSPDTCDGVTTLIKETFDGSRPALQALSIFNHVTTTDGKSSLEKAQLLESKGFPEQCMFFLQHIASEADWRVDLVIRTPESDIVLQSNGYGLFPWSLLKQLDSDGTYQMVGPKPDNMPWSVANYE